MYSTHLCRLHLFGCSCISFYAAVLESVSLIPDIHDTCDDMIFALDIRCDSFIRSNQTETDDTTAFTNVEFPDDEDVTTMDDMSEMSEYTRSRADSVASDMTMTR